MKSIAFILNKYWRVFKGRNPYSLTMRALLSLDSRRSNYQVRIKEWSSKKYYSSASFCKKLLFVFLILCSVEVSLSAKLGFERNAQQQFLPELTRKADIVLFVKEQLPLETQEAALNILAVVLSIFILPKSILSQKRCRSAINRTALNQLFSGCENINAQGPPYEPAYFLDNNLNIFGIYGSVYKEPFFVAMNGRL